MLLALVGACYAGCLELNTENFEDSVASGVTFVKFYAPWCGHCKRLAPVWDEFADATDAFKVAKVDCTTDKDVCSEYGVRGYPTLILFKDGETQEDKYQGQRDISAFVSYVEKLNPELPKTIIKNAEPEAPEQDPNSNVVTLGDANFDQARKGVWLVEFFAPWCGHCKNLVPTWEQLANQAEGYKVAKVDVTTEKGLATEFGIRSMPTIKLLIDGEVTDYSGARTVEEFDAFVKRATSGADEAEAEAGDATVAVDGGVAVLTKGNFDAEIEGKDYFVKFYAPWCGHCKRMAPTWSELATDHPEFNIGKVDCTEHNDICGGRSPLPRRHHAYRWLPPTAGAGLDTGALRQATSCKWARRTSGSAEPAQAVVTAASSTPRVAAKRGGRACRHECSRAGGGRDTPSGRRRGLHSHRGHMPRRRAGPRGHRRHPAHRTADGWRQTRRSWSRSRRLQRQWLNLAAGPPRRR